MTLKELNNIDLSYSDEYLKDFAKNDFNGIAGKEHYRILNHICKDKNIVYDIGSYRGSSAVAMSSAKKVMSYDVESLTELKKKPKNVTFNVGNCMQDKNILNADLILLDTYHDGTFEKVFLDFLRTGFKGILLMDDIFLNKEMMSVWYGIKEPKDDLTSIGHYTGTGIVYFNETRLKRCNNCG